MLIKLEEMRAQCVGSKTVVYPPLFMLYIDGVYSGHVPYGKHPHILLFRKFPPSVIKQIEAGVRDHLDQAWAKAVQPPDPPVKANEQEEDDPEDWE